MPNIIRDVIPSLNETLLATLGDEVVYSQPAAGDTTVTGLLSLGAAAEQLRPGTVGTIWFRLADLPLPPKDGDRMTFGGFRYAVSGAPEDDGYGGATLALRLLGEVVS